MAGTPKTKTKAGRITRVSSPLEGARATPAAKPRATTPARHKPKPDRRKTKRGKASTAPAGPMSPQQEAFCRAYAGEAQGNATEAAKLAGYAVDSAGVAGHRLLKLAKIQTRISALREEVQRTPGALTLEEWHILVADLARNAPKDADRAKGLDMAGRAFGVYSEKREHTGPGGLPIAMAPAAVAATLTDEELAALRAIRKRLAAEREHGGSTRSN